MAEREGRKNWHEDVNNIFFFSHLELTKEELDSYITFPLFFRIRCDERVDCIKK